MIEIDPDLGSLVTRLFDWYSTGRYSLKSLTRKARSIGLCYRKSGKPISTTTIHHMLRHRVYTGAFEWLGVIYEGIHEPLTSVALWGAVQDLLDERGSTVLQSHIAEFPFHGLVRCGHCGCTLVAEIKKGKYIYYHCTGARGKCGEPYLRQERLEEHFITHLRRLRCGTAQFEALRAVIVAHHEQHAASAPIPAIPSVRRMRFARDRNLTEDGIALLDMARTAHLSLPGLSVELKHQLLELVFAECFWANGELSATFNPPFDRFENYTVHDMGEAGESDQIFPSRERMVDAVVQPDAATRQLIARYNAMIRLQEGDAVALNGTVHDVGIAA